MRCGPGCFTRESEGRALAKQEFWVSTGGIREPYQVVNVVAASKVRMLEPDYAKIVRELIDDLARQAMRMSANGVIWIQITPVDKGGGMGYGVYATGTVVRVRADEPTEGLTSANQDG